jgi:hypothetical protein
MAKQKAPQVSPPTPFEQTNETYDTPDIQAFRAYTPNTTMLTAATKAQFDNSRRNITDSYGAYSGIPSQVARNRLRDEALAEVDTAEGLALAEGDERTQALKMAQLQTLADLTRKTKSSGYNTSVYQPQQSNIAGSLISGGAGIAAAAIA